MIPLVAMQFTGEVKWDETDFITIGGLLFGTGLTYELIARKVQSKNHRAVIVVALLATLILIWTELAVGIFD
jgi:hypothetical protein